MSEIVRNKVMYLGDLRKPFRENLIDTILEGLTTGEILEVYIDTNNRKGKELVDLRDLAILFHKAIITGTGHWEPVVVGPLRPEHDPVIPKLCDDLAASHVRSTGMTFDEYCERRVSQ